MVCGGCRRVFGVFWAAVRVFLGRFPRLRTAVHAAASLDSAGMTDGTTLPSLRCQTLLCTGFLFVWSCFGVSRAAVSRSAVRIPAYH